MAGDHLQAYLNESSFGFKRRRSESHGLLFRRLLEQAVQVGPVTYQSLVVNPSPSARSFVRPGHAA